MDWKLELVAIPVSDVDRAKAFYVDRVGFTADHDHVVSEEIRFVQLTPSGSACSIAIGQGIVDSAPGTARGLQLVVSDVPEARSELAGRGVEVSEVADFPWARSSFSKTPTATAGPCSRCRYASRNGHARTASVRMNRVGATTVPSQVDGLAAAAA